MEQILKRYKSSRLGSQEVMGHVLHDDTGFLWQQSYIQYGSEEDEGDVELNSASQEKLASIDKI